ncbi:MULTISPECIES: exopolysaccharide biosynthesis protein [unclassified Roseitalea]|uniref:exopolysaccharide biosynthesis protein n=1 Tax=unclassified Roseitalea TaxID=2639107 RepID=UPI00273F269C|nr:MULTISPECIES: exopolysaccharide biosynthesis protein [unclassified Roseitalea]
MTETGAQDSLVDLLERIQACRTGERISVGTLMERLGRATFGPALLLPALLAVMPIIGALPGVSIVMALIVLVFALQMLFGLQKPWLPRRLSTMTLPKSKLDAAIEAIKPWALRLERVLRPRWGFLTEPPLSWFGALVATCLALAMTIGALVPGGIVPPAIAMLILAVGLTVRDGLFIALSVASTLGMFGAGAWLFSSGTALGWLA